MGRPNVGKSTFLNAVLGEKVAIVSEKPQTTRNRMRGVKNLEDAQVVFIDTPGIHAREGLLNEFMVSEAVGALTDVDGVIFMVESPDVPGKDEKLIIENLKKIDTPVLLALNKIDRVDKGTILRRMEAYSRLFSFKEIVPLSASEGDGVELLLKSIVKLLPEGPRYFPEDILTDELERTIAGEIVREKVFRFTREEIPYSVAVVIEEFKESKELISIKAAINVEKDSQKGIVIGKKAAMLKRIGTAARKDIENLLNSKVYLELFVRVKKDWTKDKKALKEFGYSR